LRSGRKIRVWAAQPMKAAMASARISAKTIGIDPLSLSVMRTGTLSVWVGRKSTHGRNSSPRFQAVSKVKTPYMAMAPWAKLMTPEPL
jgi:hypothetical protein